MVQNEAPSRRGDWTRNQTVKALAPSSSVSRYMTLDLIAKPEQFHEMVFESGADRRHWDLHPLDVFSVAGLDRLHCKFPLWFKGFRPV